MVARNMNSPVYFIIAIVKFLHHLREKFVNSHVLDEIKIISHQPVYSQNATNLQDIRLQKSTCKFNIYIQKLNVHQIGIKITDKKLINSNYVK